MTTFTPTPGPWEVMATPESSHNSYVIRTSKGRIAATLYHDPSHEDAANAHLIAAAPSLLEELKTLRQAIEGHRAGALTNDGLWHYAEKAQAVIDGAEGREAPKDE